MTDRDTLARQFRRILIADGALTGISGVHVGGTLWRKAVVGGNLTRDHWADFWAGRCLQGDMPAPTGDDVAFYDDNETRLLGRV